LNGSGESLLLIPLAVRDQRSSRFARSSPMSVTTEEFATRSSLTIDRSLPLPSDTMSSRTASAPKHGGLGFHGPPRSCRRTWIRPVIATA